MLKCSNCGAEIENGMKFCGECGNQIPLDKDCPRCHAHLKHTSKFCSECGYSFLTSHGQSVGATASVGDKNVIAGDVVGLSQVGNFAEDASLNCVGNKSDIGIKLGDKNIISGDIVGHRESYKISGNATIIKNEDETKQMVRCHICGRNMIIAESFDCPMCHQKTCGDCYDKSQGLCSACISAKISGNELVYKQTLTRVLSDGRIDLSERRDLEALQKQLGLSAGRAIELEELVKAEIIGGMNGGDELSTFERYSYEKAEQAFYEEGDAQTAIDLLEPIYSAHKLNEMVLATYLDALVSHNPSKVTAIVGELHADILAAYLAEIDIFINNGNLTEAEGKLLAAENMWPEDNLLICRRVKFLLAMARATENADFLREAKDKLLELRNPKNKLEKSWILSVQKSVAKTLNQSCDSVTEEYCKENGLYYSIVKSSKCNQCEVEISGLLLNIGRVNFSTLQELSDMSIDQRCLYRDPDNCPEHAYAFWADYPDYKLQARWTEGGALKEYKDSLQTGSSETGPKTVYKGAVLSDFSNGEYFLYVSKDVGFSLKAEIEIADVFSPTLLEIEYQELGSDDDLFFVKRMLYDGKEVSFRWEPCSDDGKKYGQLKDSWVKGADCEYDYNLFSDERCRLLKMTLTSTMLKIGYRDFDSIADMHKKIDDGVDPALQIVSGYPEHGDFLQSENAKLVIVDAQSGDVVVNEVIDPLFPAAMNDPSKMEESESQSQITFEESGNIFYRDRQVSGNKGRVTCFESTKGFAEDFFFCFGKFSLSKIKFYCDSVGVNYGKILPTGGFKMYAKTVFNEFLYKNPSCGKCSSYIYEEDEFTVSMPLNGDESNLKVANDASPGKKSIRVEEPGHSYSVNL